MRTQLLLAVFSPTQKREKLLLYLGQHHGPLFPLSDAEPSNLTVNPNRGQLSTRQVFFSCCRPEGAIPCASIAQMYYMPASFLFSLSLFSR